MLCQGTQHGVQLNPDYVNAYYNRGVIKSGVGDHDGAIADYDKAIKLKPNHAKAFFARGNAKSDKKDTDGACMDWKKAREYGYVMSVDFIHSNCP